MPKCMGLTLVKGSLKEPKTTKKVMYFSISRLAPRGPGLLGIFQITTLTLYAVRDSKKKFEEA